MERGTLCPDGIENRPTRSRATAARSRSTAERRCLDEAILLAEAGRKKATPRGTQQRRGRSGQIETASSPKHQRGDELGGGDAGASCGPSGCTKPDGRARKEDLTEGERERKVSVVSETEASIAGERLGGDSQPGSRRSTGGETAGTGCPASLVASLVVSRNASENSGLARPCHKGNRDAGISLSS